LLKLEEKYIAVGQIIVVTKKEAKKFNWNTWFYTSVNRIAYTTNGGMVVLGFIKKWF